MVLTCFDGTAVGCGLTFDGMAEGGSDVDSVTATVVTNLDGFAVGFLVSDSDGAIGWEPPTVTELVGGLVVVICVESTTSPPTPSLERSTPTVIDNPTIIMRSRAKNSLA